MLPDQFVGPAQALWARRITITTPAAFCAVLLRRPRYTCRRMCRQQMLNHHWVLVPSENPTSSDIRWLQEFYMVPGLGDSDNFSSMEDVPPLESVAPKNYYHPRGIRPDEVLRIPANLLVLVDKFFSLANTEQERYLRSAYWLEHASGVFAGSRSASCLALIAAVEALLPEDRGAPRCQTCGMSRGKGPTARFRDFLEAHAPDEAGGSSQGRGNLYRARSSLSHGAMLIASDLQMSFGLDQRSSEERDLFDSA